MKRVCLFFTAALFASAALMTSCEKDDEDKDDNNDENGLVASTVSGNLDIKIEGVHDEFDPSYIFDVELTTWDSDHYDYVVLATAKYSNDGFTISLPENPPSNTLKPINDDFGFEPEDGVKISNMNAKIMQAGLYAKNEYGSNCGSIYLYKEEGDTEFYMYLIYSDSDVNVTGKDLGNEETYSLSLKKGWNKMYCIYKELPDGRDDDIYTTTPQSGMKWFFGY